jgi:hypothetical protein
VRYAVLIALLLTGCAETMIARAQERCTAMGYKPGTVDHAQCVERVSDGTYLK